MAKQVPVTISDDEKIVRGVFHPFHLKSNGKIKREAFVPPKNRCDISTMRLDYASPDICKAHLKSIEMPGKTFQGVAAFKAKDIREINDRRTGEIGIKLEAAPLNENNIERDRGEVILDTDSGNPFHSDILYSQPLTNNAEPKTEIRMIAEEIRKKSVFFRDTSLSKFWEGDNLHAFN